MYRDYRINIKKISTIEDIDKMNCILSDFFMNINTIKNNKFLSIRPLNFFQEIKKTNPKERNVYVKSLIRLEMF